MEQPPVPRAVSCCSTGSGSKVRLTAEGSLCVRLRGCTRLQVRRPGRVWVEGPWSDVHPRTLTVAACRESGQEEGDGVWGEAQSHSSAQCLPFKP